MITSLSLPHSKFKVRRQIKIIYFIIIFCAQQAGLSSIWSLGPGSSRSWEGVLFNFVQAGKSLPTQN